jgi:putative hemolysin
MLSRIAAPLVWILDWSGKGVLRLIGSRDPSINSVTEEEIKAVLAEGEQAGVLKVGEREMLAGVMRLADRMARGLMTPRREVEILNLASPQAALLDQLRATRMSRLPVRDGGEDSIVGVVAVKEVLNALNEGKTPDPRAFVQNVPVVLDISSAITVIDQLRASKLHMVLVFDELGHFEGVVTPWIFSRRLPAAIPTWRMTSRSSSCGRMAAIWSRGRCRSTNSSIASDCRRQANGNIRRSPG